MRTMSRLRAMKNLRLDATPDADNKFDPDEDEEDIQADEYMDID